jgi:hypothetical protein
MHAHAAATPLHRCSCGGTCPACRARARAQAGDSAPAIVHEVLRSSGDKLDDETRAAVEPRFGHDFGAVRLHADSRAAESADAVGASAYTVGNDIVFNAGRYAPGSTAGQRLLAHELTHVVQQSGSSGAGTVTVGHADSPAEREAERAAAAVTGGAAPAITRGNRALRRQEDPRIDTVTVSLSGSESASLSWKGTPPADAPGKDSFMVSTGKGYSDPDDDPGTCTRSCCSDPDTQCASPWDQPRKLGACCTPVGTFRTGRTRPEHNGWKYWTPVEPVHTSYGRGIALHQHTEVTGQAIGHGCIRMDEDNAKRIADYHVAGTTKVVISGSAKVYCPADRQCAKKTKTGMLEEGGEGEEAVAGLSRPDEERSA